MAMQSRVLGLTERFSSRIALSSSSMLFASVRTGRYDDVAAKRRLFCFSVNHFRNSQEAYSCCSSDFATAMPAPC